MSGAALRDGFVAFPLILYRKEPVALPADGSPNTHPPAKWLRVVSLGFAERLSRLCSSPHLVFARASRVPLRRR